ncbi:MAG: c-type cytochrome [candidate division Zixibacteria bacterium]|nr:c-type cytochrome [candidate division Zixibacteria bacterium]
MTELWNTRRRAGLLFGATVAAAALLGSLNASEPKAQMSEKFTNLKILPKDISRDELEKTMHGFTEGLGVHCSHCHVRPQGQQRGEPDWASDAKPEKQTARVMMEMMKRITGTELAKITTNRPDHVVFSCRTCHRGQARPWQIQDVLATAYRAGGFDSLTSRYESIRKKYYGTDTYDLGEQMLPDLAETIIGEDNALGDKDQAVQDLQHAAELDPKLQEYVQRSLELMKRN